MPSLPSGWTDQRPNADRMVCQNDKKLSLATRRADDRKNFINTELAQENVVNGDEQELDEVSDDAHDGEPDSAGGGDLDELLLIRFAALLEEGYAFLAEFDHAGLSVFDEIAHL